MNGGISDSAIVVITAITNLERFVLNVWFAFEERVGEEILAKIVFSSFQAERTTWIEVAAPSTTYFEVAFLIHSHRVSTRDIFVGYEIFKVNRSFPRTVLVTEAFVVTRCAISAVYIRANRVIVEVCIVCHDGDDRQVIISILIYIGTRDDGTWEESVLIQAEAIDARCSRRDIERTCQTRFPVVEGGC